MESVIEPKNVFTDKELYGATDKLINKGSQKNPWVTNSFLDWIIKRCELYDKTLKA